MPGVHSPMQRIELVAGMALLAAGFGLKQRDRAVSGIVEQGPKRHFLLAENLGVCRRSGGLFGQRADRAAKVPASGMEMAASVAPEWYRDFARRRTICTWHTDKNGSRIGTPCTRMPQSTDTGFCIGHTADTDMTQCQGYCPDTRGPLL